MAQTNLGLTRAFIEILHGQAVHENSQWLALWCRHTKESKFYNDCGAAARWAETCAAKNQDIYIGTGTFNVQPAEGRGTADAVEGVSGFWADIDVADPGAHKGKIYPLTLAEARGVLGMLGIPPSLEVLSGHGLQAWWLFREPWLLAGPEERARCAHASRAWGATLAACAKVKGWAVDSVADLARMLRIPGTMNCKVKPFVPVQSDLPIAPIRYNPGDLEEMSLPYTENSITALPIIELQYVTKDNQGEHKFLISRLDAMRAADKKFKATWEYTRNDLADKSPSAYDLAMANLLVAAEFEDQDIANALYLLRKERNANPEKALRRKYLMMTIGKARSSAVRDVKAAAAMDAIVLAPFAVENKPGTEAAPSIDFTKKIAEALCVDLRRITRHGKAENCLFSFLIGTDNEVLIGHTATLFEQRAVCWKLAEKTGVVMKSFKDMQWRQLVQAIIRSAVVVENHDSSYVQKVLGYLDSYLQEMRHRIPIEKNWQRAVAMNEPFVLDGELNIHIPSLVEHLSVRAGMRIKDFELWEMMRLAGFKSHKVTAWIKGKSICRSYWAGKHDMSAYIPDGAEGAL